MPFLPYRNLMPLHEAEDVFLAWIDKLDQEFSASKDIEHRSEIVRNALHQIYLGRPYAPAASGSADLSQLASQALVHGFDPRNATLEPEYYGDVDAARYAERKPLIWFWMMFDRSPLGLNHWLGFRLRYMLAKHVIKSLGKNVKIFHGVEISFGYNLTIEDNCVIHKYVLLDDRGEVIIREGTSVSDYANVYSHSHDLNDPMIIANEKTEIGPKARITYHATVMSGVRVGEHGLVGSMGVATKDILPYHISAGIPAKTVKVKSSAPEAIRREAEKR
jgi:acetyltransferase-like isoleucine patch superfamily enzyme